MLQGVQLLRLHDRSFAIILLDVQKAGVLRIIWCENLVFGSAGGGRCLSELSSVSFST